MSAVTTFRLRLFTAKKKMMMVMSLRAYSHLAIARANAKKIE